MVRERTRDPPWGDDLDIGLEAVEGEFEPDLVIALACASMGNVANRR